MSDLSQAIFQSRPGSVGGDDKVVAQVSQPAVSQCFQPARVDSFTPDRIARHADWKSATRQTGSLRYGFAARPYGAPNGFVARLVGSPRASRLRDDEAAPAAQARAAWGASPQACTTCFHHTVDPVDAETIGEAPTGTRACAGSGFVVTKARVRVCSPGF